MDKGQQDIAVVARFLRDLTSWAEAIPADFDAHEVGMPVQIEQPELRRSAEKLRLVMRDMLNQRHHLHMGLNALRDGFAVFDSNLELVMANHAFRSFFSAVLFTSRGVPFNRFADIAITAGLVERDGRSIPDFRAWLMDQGEKSRTIRLPDGRHIRFMMPRSADGGLAVLASDISHNIKREKQLEEARARAQDAATSRAAFLANISHEMRTPLNGIIAMAELLGEAELAAEHRLFADTIRHSAEALLALINNVLDFAQGDGRQVLLEDLPFDLPDLARSVLTLTSPLAHAKGLSLELVIDPLVATRQGDGARLRQVLLNLVGNAVKFSHRGTITVTLAAEPRSGGVVILVSDQGPGIADDEIDHVFHEFARAGQSQAQAVAGTGLGLAITAQIVAAMGGTIWVDSTIGQGSVFAMHLPNMVSATGPPTHERPDPDQTELPPPAAPVRPPAPSGDWLHILAADDNATNRLVLQKLLAHLPVDLTLVQNGAEAVAEWQASHPQMILMDISMPVMGGIEAARMIREAEAAGDLARVPIIALTAFADARTHEDINGADICAILPKPVSRATLTAAICRHIHGAADLLAQPAAGAAL
ncbi:MAG: ATP-binding protein [Paracoccus sp. (in: a-proteobacteria)]|nr:ATP-binding protein [Paracoccus sp. (in: a-proteobacteria)]